MAPGFPPGQANVSGNWQLGSTSNLAFGIEGTTQGTQYDVFNKTDGSALTLNGDLNVRLLNSFTPAHTDTFTILTTQTLLAGSFANVPSGGRLVTQDGNGNFRVVYNVVNDSVASSKVVLSDFNASECTAAPSNLVGWWPGDENANDIQSGDNGTLQGSVTFATGMVGPAFSLNGTNAFVQVPNNSAFDPTSAGSQDAWVYFNRLPSNAEHTMQIIGVGSTGRDFDLQADTDNKFRFYIAGGNCCGLFATSTTTIKTGVWYHVAGTWDSTGIRIYVNGVLEGTNSTAGVTRVPSGEPLDIGNQPFFGPRLFNGLIDEVEVFNRSLTASEVQSIYFAGNAGKCKNLCDHNPPVITVSPSNIEQPIRPGKKKVNGQTGSYVYYSVTAQDPEDGFVPATASPPSGSFFQLGTTVVTVTATDHCGNTATTTFTITVSNAKKKKK
jgi:hypothetical protein